MPSLVLSPKFPTFPTYKISITLLFQYVLDMSCLNPKTKIQKKFVICRSIVDFILLFAAPVPTVNKKANVERPRKIESTEVGVGLL